MPLRLNTSNLENSVNKRHVKGTVIATQPSVSINRSSSAHIMATLPSITVIQRRLKKRKKKKT